LQVGDVGRDHLATFAAIGGHQVYRASAGQDGEQPSGREGLVVRMGEDRQHTRVGSHAPILAPLRGSPPRGSPAAAGDRGTANHAKRGSPAAAGRLDAVVVAQDHLAEDRKNTRLNSSHVSISYAVFCLNTNYCTKRSMAL